MLGNESLVTVVGNKPLVPNLILQISLYNITERHTSKIAPFYLFSCGFYWMSFLISLDFILDIFVRLEFVSSQYS